MPVLTSTTTNRPGTFEDIPAIIDLYNRVLIDQWGKEDWDVESAENEVCAPDFDIKEQVRLWFDGDNTLVGLGIVRMWGNPPVRSQTSASVLPERPNRLDLSLEIMVWAEQTARRIAIPRCPPNVKVSVVNFMVTGYAFGEDMLSAHGMSFTRRFLTMEIDLHDDMPVSALPDGFTIRTIRYPSEVRELYRISDGAFRDHYDHIADPEGQNFESWQHHNFNALHFDPMQWFVVEANGEYAGFAWCHLGTPNEPLLGYVDVLGTLPAFRNKGVGLALLLHVFRKFYERGMKRAGLGVDSESPTGATRLYERAGMKAIASWDTYLKVIRDGVDLIRQ